MSQSQANSAHHRKKVRGLRFRYLSIACLCLFISMICVILECFTLFNIEYYDGEDLMQLYWGFWCTYPHQRFVLLDITFLSNFMTSLHLTPYHTPTGLPQLTLTPLSSSGPPSRFHNRNPRRNSAILDRPRQRRNALLGRRSRYSCPRFRCSRLDFFRESAKRI